MMWSREGFLVPRVDESSCVACGLCVKMCPALAPKEKHPLDFAPPVESCGVWHRDESTLLDSSSGGAFTALAKMVIEEGGCVYGVVWQDKLTAVITKAETIGEVAAMRGSKYTMAVPGTAYRSVREELKKGRKVLFSGTPCQVHALKAFLRKPCENLVTVDIVCHGVPSRLLLEKYVADAEQRTGKEIRSLSFRGKLDSWMCYNQTKNFSDGSSEVTYLGKDEYMSLFLDDIALNRCCYNCRYAHFPRQGDISLADFWGVEAIHPDWPIRHGIGAVIVNTPAGAAVMKGAARDLEVHPVLFGEIYQGQQVVYTRLFCWVPYGRRLFLRDVDSLPLSDLVAKYRGRRWIGPFRIAKYGWLNGRIRKIEKLLLKIARRLGMAPRIRWK